MLDTVSDEVLSVPAGLTTEGLLGRRYMARIIDSIAGVLLVYVLSLAFAATAGPQLLLSVPTRTAVALLFYISYGSLLESAPWQATLGKRVMGLRVYNWQGGRVSLLQAAGRNLLKDGPFFVFTVLPAGQVLSLLWLVAHLIVMHHSPVYQAIHDRALHTWVAAPEEVTQLRIT